MCRTWQRTQSPAQEIRGAPAVDRIAQTDGYRPIVAISHAGGDQTRRLPCIVTCEESRASPGREPWRASTRAAAWTPLVRELTTASYRTRPLPAVNHLVWKCAGVGARNYRRTTPGRTGDRRQAADSTRVRFPGKPSDTSDQSTLGPETVAVPMEPTAGSNRVASEGLNSLVAGRIARRDGACLARHKRTGSVRVHARSGLLPPRPIHPRPRRDNEDRYRGRHSSPRGLHWTPMDESDTSPPLAHVPQRLARYGIETRHRTTSRGRRSAR